MGGLPIPPLTIAAAVNDRGVLATCLQRSPDLAAEGITVRIYEGSASAACAYNAALDAAETDIVVLVHQDVYLPAGFTASLREGVATLSRIDPDWAVAGVIGLDEAGQIVGETWSSGLRRVVGRKVETPTPVVSLDEVLLVVRRSAGVRFDEAMPGFHLYAADVVLSAREAGHRSYVLDLSIIHHSRPVVRLDRGYRRAYRFMQRKWSRSLPLPNLVCPIVRSPVPLLMRDARLRWLNRGKGGRVAPAEDPAAIAERLGLEKAR